MSIYNMIYNLLNKARVKDDKILDSFRLFLQKLKKTCNIEKYENYNIFTLLEKIEDNLNIIKIKPSLSPSLSLSSSRSPLSSI